jgi:Fe-S-cluster containining protein
MPLSQEDAEKISKHTGLKVLQFTKPLTETSFILELANDPKTRACVFLETNSTAEDASGTCKIHSHRPSGCRSYPVVLDLEDLVFKDELCPYGDEFPEATEEQRLVLLSLDSIIQHQASLRAQADVQD